MPGPVPDLVLAALRDRLVAARTPLPAPDTGFSYPLNAATLPTGSDGDPGAVLSVLTGALGPAPVIQAGEPALAAGALVLDGRSTVLGGGRPLPTTLTFDVVADGGLRATWAVTPDAGWALPDAFPALGDGPWETVPLTEVVLLCTTYAHADDRAAAQLRPGLNLWATLTVDPALRHAGARDPLTVRVGGPITVGAAGSASFTLTGDRPLGALRITRIGQAPLTLTEGVVALTAEPVMTISGRVRLGEQVLDAVVDVPSGWETMLRLVLTPPDDVTLGARAALSLLAEADVPAAWLPAALLDLAGARVSRYELLFDPSGEEPSQAAFTLNFATAARWTPVRGLDLVVTAPVLTVTVNRAAWRGRDPITGYGASLQGTLLVRDRPYTVLAEAGEDGLWWLTASGDVPGVDVLARLAGVGQAEALEVLPPSLRELGDLRTPARIAIAVDPGNQALAEVWFRLAQTRPWPLAGGAITVSGWTADVEIHRDDGSWAVRGLLSGTVGLGSTRLEVTLPLPAEEGTLTLELAEPVTLPTLGQALAVLGVRPAGLPTALDTLGGLSVTVFTVSADLAATTIVGLSVMAEQAADWEILPGLTVTGVRLALATSATEAVAGAVSGVVVLAGRRVDAAMRRNPGEGPWTLWIAQADRVHVRGFAELDTWLGPAALPSGVPARLPFAGGLDVGEAHVRFGGPGGTVDEVGVVVRTSDPWPVGPVPLTRIRVALAVPYPISPSTVHGEISAVVTIGGVPIGVGAARPADGDWVFTGTLLDGLSVDVVAAANTAGSGFALPAGAVARGLPATLTVRRATVTAVPAMGRFAFTGDIALKAWPVTVGGANLLLAALTVAVEVPDRDAPAEAHIGAAFAYAGINAAVRLKLGGPDRALVLDGVVADARTVDLPAVTGGLASAATAWTQSAPPGAPSLVFGGSAVLRLDVPGSRLLLSGSVHYGTATTAGALVYTEGTGVYAVALSIGPGFRFGDLVPALAAVDDVLHVTEARLIVCDAGGRSLGDLATATNAVLGELAPTGPRPLDGLDESTLSLHAGAYFTASVDFTRPGVFTRLLQIGDSGSTPVVHVTAQVDRLTPAATAFTAGLPTITLLGRVAFAGLTLTYRGTDAHRLTLVGQVRLLALSSAAYAFDVRLTVDDTGMTGIATSGQQIAEPLGLPGITLSALSLEVGYRWATADTPRSTRLVLRGGLRLGPAPAPGGQDTRPALTGTLVLRDGAPVLFHVTLAADLSIGDFLTQCLTGAGASWPGAYVDVTLLAGTRLSYYVAAADPGGAYAGAATPPFDDGFTVAAAIRVTLVDPVTVRGLIRVVKEQAGDASYSAVEATLALPSAVDLGPVSLAGGGPPPAVGPYTGGPSLKLRTGRTPSLSLITGVNFLGAPFVSAEVTVRRDDGRTRFSGTVTAARGPAPFRDAQFRLTYAGGPGRATQLTVDDWPSFPWPRALVDVVQTLKDICGTGGSPCGRISEAVQAAFDTTFHLAPSAALEGTSLVFTLTGTYELTVRGAAGPFLSVTLPALTVGVPVTTRWEDLPEVLASGVASSSATVVRDLLSRPDKAALLLAMAFGPQALAVGLKLACDELVEGGVAAAADAAATAIAAAGGVTAAGAATAASAAVATSLNDSASHAPARDDGPLPGLVAVKHLSYGAGSFSLAWDAARGATGYEVEVHAPDGQPLASPTQVTGRLTASVPVRVEEITPGVHTGRVRALRGTTTGDWAAIGVSLLDPPRGVVAYWGGASVLVTWQASQGAAAYEVLISDERGEVARVRKTSGLKEAPALTRRDGWRLWVQVRAIAGGVGPWSELVPVADQPPGR
ncbi:hypothetical protein [Microbispora sp. H10885]|uniref:hypothetical protein n=1 Tax=Microbispora sp. H10885 TaxID=2729110 RepID=UPI0015FFD5A6|nr:hypothetical protein [Microbispora sp. H10885]